MKTLTNEQIKKDTRSSILLFLGVIAALIISNNAYSLKYYRAFINYHLQLDLGIYQLDKTILHWVNDGLMAIFFFMLGLGMKYHMQEGEFQQKKQLILPTLAAFGGFIVPALIYYFINKDYPAGLIGWATPVATDTAFLLAIVSLFGTQISNSTKIFLIGLSIIDDILAILVLAIFYTPNLDLTQLYLCSIPILGMVLLHIYQLPFKWLYYILGIFLWLFTVKSGIHGTIAGIISACFIPIKVEHNGKTYNLVKEIESSIYNFVAFFVLPFFSFANCELPLHELSINDFSSKIAIGSFIGLLVGKCIGVYSFSMIALKLKLGHLPYGTNKFMFFGFSVLCGIGFTLSLFIGLQAFDLILHENQMKIGVLSASFLSAILGLITLKIGLYLKANPQKIPLVSYININTFKNIRLSKKLKITT